MSLVSLVSGGLDSTLMALLAQESGLHQVPLFVDYGQRAAEQEWRACNTVFSTLGLPSARRMRLSGWGSVIKSGLTDSRLDIVQDAFLPGRNMLLAIAALSLAFQEGAGGVAIGLLNEAAHLFPDQTRDFLSAAESLALNGLGRRIQVVAPLMDMTKADVVALAKTKNIMGTYSCHAGDAKPCGACISCKEFPAPEEEC